MNLHPVFVHFPIALLTIYSLFEIFRLNILTRQAWYFYLKAVLVIAGAVMAAPTILTGLYVGRKLEGDKFLGPIVEMHERFAFFTAGIFIVIALAYVLAWYAQEKLKQGIVFESKLIKFAQALVKGKWTIALAVLGFISLTITGGIGGAMVFGPEAGPFFKPVFEFLIKF